MRLVRGYTIKYVSLQTGLKPYLIRSWEARHSAICPKRSSSNRRVFSDEDINRLILLKRAVAAGQTISNAARMSDSDLTLMVMQGAGSHTPDGWFPSQRPDHFVYRGSDVTRIVDEALTQVIHLDPSSLEKVLAGASVEMPRLSFLQRVILPLFQKIGELWRIGRLKTINEHMASVVVRSMLWDMLRAVEVSGYAPRILVTTPAGQWHEFGALASALAASESGWRVHYFGPDLPSEEIAYAVWQLDARALVLSICHRMNDHRLAAELQNIRRLAGGQLLIFVGGPGAAAARKTLARIDAFTGDDLGAFRDRLESLLKIDAD